MWNSDIQNKNKININKKRIMQQIKSEDKVSDKLFSIKLRTLDKIISRKK